MLRQSHKKRGSFSIVNSVAIYEAQLKQKSFPNKEAFCMSTSTHYEIGMGKSFTLTRKTIEMTGVFENSPNNSKI